MATVFLGFPACPGGWTPTSEPSGVEPAYPGPQSPSSPAEQGSACPVRGLPGEPLLVGHVAPKAPLNLSAHLRISAASFAFKNFLKIVHGH